MAEVSKGVIVMEEFLEGYALTSSAFFIIES